MLHARRRCIRRWGGTVRDVVELCFEIGEVRRAPLFIRRDGQTIAAPREGADVCLVDDEVLKPGNAKRNGPVECRRIDDKPRLTTIRRRHLSRRRIDPQKRQAARIVGVAPLVGNFKLVEVPRRDSIHIRRPVSRIGRVAPERHRLKWLRRRLRKPHDHRSGVRRPHAEAGSRLIGKQVGAERLDGAHARSD